MKALNQTALAALGALILTLVVVLLLETPYFSELESETGDEIVALRYAIDKSSGRHQPDVRLLTAAIDQRSIQDLGAWPLPRADHGQFLSVLAPEKPAEVGWDVFFTEPAANHPDDDALVQGAALFPHMVMAAELGQGTSAPVSDPDLLPTRPFQNVVGDTRHLFSSADANLPIPALRKETYLGFVNEPGTVRRTMPLIVNVNGKILPSFDCQVLMQYWRIGPEQVSIEIGKSITYRLTDGSIVRVPIDNMGRLLLNYRGKLEDFHPMSYVQMGKGLDDKLHQVASGERDHLPSISGKIVIVGVTFSGTDAGITPLNPVSPLVVAHLNALTNILQNDFLLRVPALIWIPCYFLFLFGVAFLMLRLRVLPMLGMDLAAMILLALALFALLYATNYRFPLAMPEIGLVLLGVMVPSRGFFGEEREKAKIKGIMQAYLSDKVMQKVLQHPDNLKLGGIKQEITIMFCDIRGFTAFCDERDPEETMKVLNEYMETMTQVVFRHDGTIDKYIGDCIMAFWNAPETQSDHAQRAVLCAMEMRKALFEFKQKRAGTELEHFECGIGIHTGEALVGNMGSSLKRNYTAMGSSVNLASRLESLTKKLEEQIVISEDTLRQLQGELPIIDRGEQAVAGVARPVHVYAIVSPQEYARALASAAAEAPV